MNNSNPSILPLSILGFETGPKRIKLDFQGHSGEFALRIYQQARNHARAFVKCQELLAHLGTFDVTIAGIATGEDGHDYLVVVDSIKAVLADQTQLEPWGYDQYIAETKETLQPSVITV